MTFQLASGTTLLSAAPREATSLLAGRQLLNQYYREQPKCAHDPDSRDDGAHASAAGWAASPCPTPPDTAACGPLRRVSRQSP